MMMVVDGGEESDLANEYNQQHIMTEMQLLHSVEPLLRVEQSIVFISNTTA